jgi:hypothetical protein
VKGSNVIQFIIAVGGFLLLSHVMSTPEQREAARLRVKKLEPIFAAIAVIGIGFLVVAWIVG